MAPKTETKTIASINPKLWNGMAGKDSGYLFFGFMILMVVACLILMIFIPPLRSFGAVALVSSVSSLALTIAYVVSDANRQKRFLMNLTSAVNEFIVETTGDQSIRISVARFRQMIDIGAKLSLSINGLPCLELKATGDRNAERKIVAAVTAPDYGLDSFDRLLMEEAKRSK